MPKRAINDRLFPKGTVSNGLLPMEKIDNGPPHNIAKVKPAEFTSLSMSIPPPL